MTILPLLIGLSILLMIVAVGALFWAVDHDQFDDMELPRLLPVLDAHVVGSAATEVSAATNIESAATRSSRR
jgi:cbb3-type cytochrome oxidase maturation protein